MPATEYCICHVMNAVAVAVAVYCAREASTPLDCDRELAAVFVQRSPGPHWSTPHSSWVHNTADDSSGVL